MASAFSHAIAAFGISACFYHPDVPKRVWIIGAACAVLPDIDVIGFRFGIHYADFWGHRGFTHSLAFAALLATMIVLAAFPRGTPGLGCLPLWAFLFLVTASHGFLDALTDGGLGVAFLLPIQQSTLLPAVDSNSRITDRYNPFLFPPEAETFSNPNSFASGSQPPSS